jgi:hypothetical protein
VTYVAGANGKANSVNPTVTVPSTAATGDVLVIHLDQNNTDVVTGAPAGVVLRSSDSTVSTYPSKLYTAIVDGTTIAPGTVLTWTLSVTRAWSLDLIVERGIDNTTPVSGVAVGHAAASPAVMPTLATTGTTRLVEVAAGKANGTIITAWTAPTGWTVQQTAAAFSTFSGSAAIAIPTGDTASAAGSYGGETYTPSSATGAYVTYLLALNPASTTTTYPATAGMVSATALSGATTLTAAPSAGMVSGTSLTGTAVLTTTTSAGMTSASRLAATASSGAAYQRGVNSAGADFGGARSVANGTYDSDASFAFYAARGHKKIRIPFLMERLLPTLGGALNATELSRLTAAVNSCTTRGMTAVLDPHNYARYTTADGVVHVLDDADGVFTRALLADFWTKLSTAFKGHGGVEYDLMNEPHDLLAQTSPGADMLGGGDFEDGTVGGFAAGTNTAIANSTAVAYAGTHSLALTAVAAGAVRASKRFTAAAGTAYTLTAKVRAAATVAQGFTQINWFDSTGTYLSTSNGVFANDTTTGWTALDAVITAPTGATAGEVVCAVQTSPAAGEVHYFDGVTVSVGTSVSAAQVWERAAQACVTAIRGNADTTWIWVPGVAYEGAQNWWTNHPTWWITDSAAKSGPTAHYYFDSDNSGRYVNTYTFDNNDAVNKGYASLTAKSQVELGRFTDGCASRSLKGWIGEIGWPNTDTTYNAVGDACYTLADSKAQDVTYWAAGEQWGTTYLLSIYTGTPQAVSTSVAATVEAHPSATGALAGTAGMISGSALTGSATATLPVTAGMTSGSSLVGSTAATETASAGMTSGSSLAGSATARVVASAGMVSASSMTATGTLTASVQAGAPMTSASALSGSATAGGTTTASMTSGTGLSGSATTAATAPMQSATSLGGSVTATTQTGASMQSGTALSSSTTAAAVVAASMASGTALTGSSASTTQAAASMSSGSTLTASTAATLTTAASMTSGTALTGQASLAAAPVAGMASATALSASGSRTQPAQAAMASATALGGTTTLTTSGQAAMTSGTILTGQSGAQSGVAAMASATSLSGSGTASLTTSSAMVSGTALGASVAASLPAISAMTSGSTLTAAVVATSQATAGMTSSTALSANTAGGLAGQASMASGTALTGSVAATLAALSAMTSGGALNSPVTVTSMGIGAMVSATALIGAGTALVSATASMASGSSLTAVATVVYIGPISVSARTGALVSATARTAPLITVT